MQSRPLATNTNESQSKEPRHYPGQEWVNAIQSNNLKKIKELLKTPVGIFAIDLDIKPNKHAMHYAIENLNPEIVGLLLYHGANPNNTFFAPDMSLGGSRQRTTPAALDSDAESLSSAAASFHQDEYLPDSSESSDSETPDTSIHISYARPEPAPTSNAPTSLDDDDNAIEITSDLQLSDDEQGNYSDDAQDDFFIEHKRAENTLEIASQSAEREHKKGYLEYTLTVIGLALIKNFFAKKKVSLKKQLSNAEHIIDLLLCYGMDTHQQSFSPDFQKRISELVEAMDYSDASQARRQGSLIKI